MENQLNTFLFIVKKDLGLFLSVSFGLFLFILFFQPFPLNQFDFENSLLFVAGLSGITFLSMVIIRIITRGFPVKYHNDITDSSILSKFEGMILLIIISVAFAFYLRFVGKIPITFHIMFKVVIMGLSAPISLRFSDIYQELKSQNEALVNEREQIQKKVERFEEDYLNKSLIFLSDTSAENLTLSISEVAYIKSADNYVEIIFNESGELKKKLLRNTLRNIELQVKPFAYFIRCHRTCIVNSIYIEKLNRNYGNHWISIRGSNEQIPVSRQYLLKLKEYL